MESLISTSSKPQHIDHRQMSTDHVGLLRTSSANVSKSFSADQEVINERLSAASALDQSRLQAQLLTADDYKLASSVLFNAYFHDPLFVALFRASEDGYEMRLRSAIQLELDAFFRSGQLVIGLFHGNTLLAVACLIGPNAELQPERCWNWRLNMLLTAGMFTTQQFIAQEKSVRAAVPHEQFHLLSMIGVNPHYQGKGFGRLLMSAVFATVNDCSESSGIATYVRLPDCRAFFEAEGFMHLQRVVAGTCAGDVMFWRHVAKP